MLCYRAFGEGRKSSTGLGQRANEHHLWTSAWDFWLNLDCEGYEKNAQKHNVTAAVVGEAWGTEGTEVTRRPRRWGRYIGIVFALPWLDDIATV